MSRVTCKAARVATPAEAIDLLAEHDLVVDATADARTTALLRWAAEQTGHPMMSVCLQREGAIARADRSRSATASSLPRFPPCPARRCPGSAAAATLCR